MWRKAPSKPSENNGDIELGFAQLALVCEYLGHRSRAHIFGFIQLLLLEWNNYHRNVLTGENEFFSVLTCGLESASRSHPSGILFCQHGRGALAHGWHSLLSHIRYSCLHPAMSALHQNANLLCKPMGRNLTFPPRANPNIYILMRASFTRWSLKVFLPSVSDMAHPSMPKIWKSFQSWFLSEASTGGSVCGWRWLPLGTF